MVWFGEGIRLRRRMVKNLLLISSNGTRAHLVGMHQHRSKASFQLVSISREVAAGSSWVSVRSHDVGMKEEEGEEEEEEEEEEGKPVQKN